MQTLTVSLSQEVKTMVKVDVRTTSEGVVAMIAMTGAGKECLKECAVIPASVLEQYAQALRQNGITEDEIDELIKLMFVNMMDQIKMHIKCIGDIVDGR